MGKIIFVLWIGNLIRKLKYVCMSLPLHNSPRPESPLIALVVHVQSRPSTEENELMSRARDSDSKSPGRLQILHYNIDRFPEIKDLRGLETLLVAR